MQTTFDTTRDLDAACEFLAIELMIKPTPLIIYTCYLNEFVKDVAMIHYQRIKSVINTLSIVERYRSHRIVVLGDFNLYDIVWTSDDDDESVFLPHTIVDSNGNQSRSIYNDDALEILKKMLGLPLSRETL